MTGRRRPRRRHHHPVARENENQIAPPPVTLSGQVCSRIRVYVGPSPRDIVPRHAIHPLFRTDEDREANARAEAAADEAARDQRAMGDYAGLMQPTARDRHDPVFWREPSAEQFASVGFRELQCTLRKRGHDGEYPRHGQVFSTDDSGRFDAPLPLEMGATYRLTVVFEPGIDESVEVEALQQSEEPWRDHPVGHVPRDRDPTTEPDRVRYYRETAVVTFTMPSRIPARGQVVDVRMRARHYLKDVNPEQRAADRATAQGRTHHPDHDPGDAYDEEETFYGSLYGPDAENGPGLELFDYGAILLGSFVLKVNWMSQRLHNVRSPLAHPFRGNPRDWETVLGHLCVASCVAMILNSYGETITTRDVAHASARFFLDQYDHRSNVYHWRLLDETSGALVLAESGPVPAGISHGGLNANLIVRGPGGVELAGYWPHMKPSIPPTVGAERLGLPPGEATRWFDSSSTVVSNAAEAANQAMDRFATWRAHAHRRPEREVSPPSPPPTYSDRRTVLMAMSYNEPNESPRALGESVLGDRLMLKFLSLGWPAIVFQDLRGDIEHGRVCYGVVLKQDGTVHQAYTHNPNHVEEVMPARDLVVASKGWCILARDLSTREALARVVSGSLGSLPESLPYIR